MKGSVGRAFAKAKRYREDEVYREKMKRYAKKWGKNNLEKVRLREKKIVKKLNEFKNKRCKKCNILLNYKTKGNYCNKHFKMKKGGKNGN